MFNVFNKKTRKFSFFFMIFLKKTFKFIHLFTEITELFFLNLYSSNNKIKFKRTLKVLITNNFEKLKNELEKVHFINK